jgi:hypothetical protein
MEKDEWYRDRILWRAKQSDLFSKTCSKFSDLPIDRASIIEETITEPFSSVIVFWRSQDTWTVLGTRTVFSFHDGKLRFSMLDEIDKQISVVQPDGSSSEDIKTKSNFILLEKSGTHIWVPEGKELFGLMNILLMFPLKIKNITC